MSFKKEKRDLIKQYILEKIDEGHREIAAAAVSAFEISENTVYRYLREMIRDGVIEKGSAGYALCSSSYGTTLSRTEGEVLDEADLFEELAADKIRDFPENVYNIWIYSFSEMMNNAIEHSGADRICVTVKINRLNTEITIEDNGIGAFENIRGKLGLTCCKEAARELFKGKITTDNMRHSGEGIFFTGRALDDFSIISDGIVFSRDRFGNTACCETDKKKSPGTIVRMKLSNTSARVIADVFDAFSSPDDGFYRTSIPVASMFDSFPVSRSQARRLYRSIERFREVELDFSGVAQIGQGFAHEIFVVYKREHPEIEILTVNAGEQVQKMVNHVLNTK